MPLNTAALTAGAQGIATAAPYIALHTAVPDATGSNQATSARLAASWAVANGVATSSAAKNFSGGAASGPVLYFGFWSALTGGTFYGYQAVTGDQAFNAAGQYTLNTVTITQA